VLVAVPLAVTLFGASAYSWPSLVAEDGTGNKRSTATQMLLVAKVMTGDTVFVWWQN